MKYLIVNADDFGASHGINRAVMELHQVGILTSTSLMIDCPAGCAAARLALGTPELGVGLHVTLTNEAAMPIVDFDNSRACVGEIKQQLDRFLQVLGRIPTHIDSHQNVHRDQRLNLLFREVAVEHKLPLREHSSARYFSSFYGQWDGDTHPEWISVDNLLRMLAAEPADGATELSCHPGYPDAFFDSPYNIEREIELQTLRDPRVRDFLAHNRIQLISFRDLSSVVCV